MLRPQGWSPRSQGFFMRSVIDQSDREFLEQLHRTGPATIQEICGTLGVTATAVRQRLSRLQGLGLITRESVRAGRGRPHHTYRLTDGGLRELGDNYGDLAMILWRELQNIQEPSVRARLLDGIQQALVERYGHAVQGTSLYERVSQLRDALAERGFDVEVASNGELPVLRENNCPYLELATSDPSICELEHAVFQKVLGAELTLAQCCLDGHSCCEFQPAGHPGGPAAVRGVESARAGDTVE